MCGAKLKAKIGSKTRTIANWFSLGLFKPPQRPTRPTGAKRAHAQRCMICRLEILLAYVSQPGGTKEAPRMSCVSHHTKRCGRAGQTTHNRAGATLLSPGRRRASRRVSVSPDATRVALAATRPILQNRTASHSARRIEQNSFGYKYGVLVPNNYLCRWLYVWTVMLVCVAPIYLI